MDNIILTTEPQLKQLIIEALSSALGNAQLPNSVKSQATRYLSTEEAAKLIKKTPGALRQIVHRGEITSIKRGNHLLFLEDDLYDWIEKGRRDVSSTKDPAYFLKTNRVK